MRTCHWTQDSDGCWTSGCGHAFEFNDGTPKANGARFCLYCGGKLTQESYRDPSHRKLPTAADVRGILCDEPMEGSGQ